ncbi:golgin subfamily A member 2-like isoform X1 [Dermacentor variabilis]|uniref:golgin subfamily A member 2-like isoform X1 n=3 Tax=Dermacentor variabilis TaxID=34621 RepID=UPI003F5C8BB0
MRMSAGSANMADDADRKHKVAAGLKKLKQFQQRSVKKTTKRRSSDTLSPQTVQDDQASAQQLDEQSSAMSQSSMPKEALPVTSQSCQDLSQLRDDVHPNQRVLSSTESLRQITLQLNGLMADTNAALNGEMATLADSPSSGALRGADELLRRNQELATTLETLQQDRDQLEFQLQELKAKLARQQREFDREREEMEEQSRREQVALNDQLQVHIQTIGILVAEKTELQSALSQSQQTAKQKAVETEELQGRLKALRERNGDLERKLSTVSSQSQVQEKSTKESQREVDRLNTENYRLSKSMEELRQELAELSEKLSRKSKEAEEGQQELARVRQDLSMAQLYAQQLGGSQASEEALTRMEQLHQEKVHFERRAAEYKDAMEQITAEKQQMASHYQSYVDNVSQQLDAHKTKLVQMSDEKEKLEKKLQELLSQHAQPTSQVSEDPEIRLKLQQYEQELETLRAACETQGSDNQQLSSLLAEREAQAEELAAALERLREDHVESSRLLETIQSEKVAASRALSQNRELKRQLEEMQDVFVKLSNDKLELTEQLQKEQHVTKELGERLGQQEEELRELRDQLATKEGQVQGLEQLSSREHYQQSQLADRVRHYQAQCQLTEILQQELAQAQARTNALVTQNSDLRKALAERAQLAVDVQEKDSSKVHDLVASLSASVQQLELERDQLVHQLDEQRTQREALQHQLLEFKKSEEELLSHEQEEVTREGYAKMKRGMQQLEDRFKATMDQIADLSDQKQQLEHLVTQLQGETDTIADYIALYQVQRGIMRKRAAEKDDYISQLAKDREDLKAKLAELQCLIVRLLEDRQQQSGQSVLPLPGKVLTVSSFADALQNGPNAGDTGSKPFNGSSDEVQEDVTAKKIMHLLTEIESSSAVDGSPVPDTFHPCPVCSGRLLTV